jgi:deoxycytidylate deaminase
MTETRSTCPYCGVGCGVIIESQGIHITGVRGDPAHPANFGQTVQQRRYPAPLLQARAWHNEPDCCNPCSSEPNALVLLLATIVGSGAAKSPPPTHKPKWCAHAWTLMQWAFMSQVNC